MTDKEYAHARLDLAFDPFLCIGGAVVFLTNALSVIWHFAHGKRVPAISPVLAVLGIYCTVRFALSWRRARRMVERYKHEQED